MASHDHNVSEPPQVKLVYDIFADSGVVEFFRMEERKVMAFIAAVCSHYHKNPYHNFSHVVYVLHCTYMLIMRSEVAKSLTRVDQLVLLIAALCHDVDHDGKTCTVAWQQRCQLPKQRLKHKAQLCYMYPTSQPVVTEQQQQQQEEQQQQLQQCLPAGFECAQQQTGLTSDVYKPFQGGPAGAAHHSSVSHHEPAVCNLGFVHSEDAASGCVWYTSCTSSTCYCNEVARRSTQVDD